MFEMSVFEICIMLLMALMAATIVRLTNTVAAFVDSDELSKDAWLVCASGAAVRLNSIETIGRLHDDGHVEVAVSGGRLLHIEGVTAAEYEALRRALGVVKE